MTAKIYNCETLFLTRMENTLLNNKLVSGIACYNNLTNRTVFCLNLHNASTVRFDYYFKDYKTYEARLLAFFREAFELLGDYDIEETMDK